MTRPLKITAAVLLTLFTAALVLGTAFYLNPIWFADQQVRLHLRHQHVQSKYLLVDGYNLHYFEAPAAPGTAGTPLVLIHGLGARGEDWSALIPTLAAHGFHVYVPDLLGYGRSPKPDADYSISLQERTVTDFMQALHLEHADVAGWSMGGWIAMKLTIDHPQLVGKLILYDSAGIYFPATFNASLFTPADSAGLDRLISMLSPQPHALPPFIRRAAIRKLQANSWVIDRSVDSMTGGRDLLDFQLFRIHAPTLIVWGAQDRLIPPAVGEAIHRGIPGSKLVTVPACGHLAPAECWKPVLGATLPFLAQ